MSRIFVLVIMLCAMAVYGDAAPTIGGAVFQVQSSVDADSLKTDSYRVRGMFVVHATVTNRSGSDQAIIVWTQYGWSWVTDNSAVRPGIEALTNFPTQKTLRPRESYSAEVEMSCDPALPKPVTFRLGFVPRTQRPAAGVKDFAPIGGVFWSNPITLPGR